jgi:hypothetical protein
MSWRGNKTGESKLTNEDERRKHPRIKAKWPITIITDQSSFDGESMNITDSGLFIRCVEQMQENEICQLIIRIPGRDPIIVKGTMIRSNLGGADHKGHLSGIGFSFIKISKEDRQFFNEMTADSFKTAEEDKSGDE